VVVAFCSLSSTHNQTNSNLANPAGRKCAKKILNTSIYDLKKWCTTPKTICRRPASNGVPIQRSVSEFMHEPPTVFMWCTCTPRGNSHYSFIALTESASLGLGEVLGLKGLALTTRNSNHVGWLRLVGSLKL